MRTGFWGRVGAVAAWVGGLAREAAVRRGLWVLLFVAATAALFVSASLPSEVNLRAGQVAPFTITSPRDLVDQSATAGARQAAAAKVAPSYSVNTGVIQSALAGFDAQAASIDAARAELAVPLPSASGASAPAAGAASSPSASRAAPPASSAAASSASAGSAAARRAAAASARAAQASRVQAQLASQTSALQSALGLGVPAADYASLLQAPAPDVTSVEQEARQKLEALLTSGVVDDPADLAQASSTLQSEILVLQAPAAVDRVFSALAAQALVPDKFVDEQATAAAQQQAEDAVPPVTIARGQVIVRQGDVVTRDEIGVLLAAGLLHPGGLFGLVAGGVLLALLLLCLSWAFLAQFHPRAMSDERHLVLFGSVLVAALAGLRLVLPISAYLTPVAWSAILAAVAFGPGVALFVGGLGGIAAGLLVHDLSVGVVAVTGAWAAVFSLRRLTQRSDLVRAGLYAAVSQAAAALLLLGLFLGQDSSVAGSLASSAASHPVLRAAAAAAFGGLLSGVLAIGTLPGAEALGVLTPFKLLELANPGQPLLRRLMVEAPGTYHHSLMVGNLAEAACEAVGGDALLVRAGSYYHDIGKMKRPVFFVENQLGGENPHDKLSPQLSSLVITSHVRDGVEMARQARLPEEIADFIRTHHGTTLVRYFYNAARREMGQAASGGPEGRLGLASGAAAAGPGRGAPAAQAAVSEEDFRYEGPLPATREAAVVMLADGVEAAVRSLRHPSAEDIEGAIQRIIADRLEDGQLDLASLTLKDLHAISVTFRRILLGAYHARVPYPEALEDEVAPPGLQAPVPRLPPRTPPPPPPRRAGLGG